MFRILCLFCISFAALADMDIAGRVHLSGDFVDTGDTRDVALASNGTRLSLRGTEALNYDLVALWKLETEVDATGQSQILLPRNRYVGIVSVFGTVIGGFHDTPLKSFLDKVDLMSETIADSRAILGTVKRFTYHSAYTYLPSFEERFNVRAKYALMYVSPPIAGVELRALVSPGKGMQDDDDGTTPLTSMSAFYKSQVLYLGAAYEEQKRYEQTGATRLIGGLQFERSQFNVMVERLDSSTQAHLDRFAGGASAAYMLGDATFEMQAFHARHYHGAVETGATLVAVGMVYKITKQSELYGIVARMENESNAGFVLAAGDHGGDRFEPSSLGQNLNGASLGMIYKF